MSNVREFREVWEPDPDWRIVDEGRCRYPRCGRPAVAELRRSNGWWRYCERHLYGRRIENGQVVSRRLVEVDE